MKFIDSIIILVLILILLSIVVNMFVYGRDFTNNPVNKKAQKKRHIIDYYPGSIDDDYESGYDSESSYSPSKIARYVSNQIN